MQLQLAFDRPTPGEELEELRRLLQATEAGLAGKGRGRLPALAIDLRLRNNRSTMARVAYKDGSPPTWQFSLARSLFDLAGSDCLPLCQSLLLKARGLKPAREMEQAGRDLRDRWLDRRIVEAPSPAEDDPHLAEFLREVAEHCQAPAPARGCPGILWYEGLSRRMLGRYLVDAHRIEIHGALQHKGVPSAALRTLVHHEYLHACLGFRQQGNRRVYHHGEFRRLERAWPDYEISRQFFDEHWPKLYRRWNKCRTQGRPTGGK